MILIPGKLYKVIHDISRLNKNDVVMFVEQKEYLTKLSAGLVHIFYAKDF